MLQKADAKEQLNVLVIDSAPDGKSLHQRAAVGAAWMIALKFADRFLVIARTVILARLLAPKDFGIFGVALLSISFLEVFTQTGFHSALIQREDDIKPYLNTAWTVQIIRGAFLALLLFIAAPFIGEFFKEPEAVLPLRIVGFSVLINGFTNTGIVDFQKELQFNKQFSYQISGSIIAFATVVAMALYFQNVWALVVSYLLKCFVHLIMSYRLHEYRPRLSIDMDKLKSLYSFGIWILFTYVIVFFANQSDSIMIGKVLDVTSLGLYQMAYLIANTPFSEIGSIATTVGFPMYSKLQGNGEMLRDSYRKIVRLTGFLSLPLAGIIFILGDEIVMVFLGEKWLSIVPVLKVLALWGACNSVISTVSPVYQALGKPKYDFYLGFVRFAVMAIFVYHFTKWWGIKGTAISVLISMVAAVPFACFWLIRMTGFKISNVFQPVIPSLAGAFVMIFVIFFVKKIIVLPPLYSLILLTPLSLICFLGSMLILDYKFISGIKENVLFLLKRNGS